MEKMVLQIPKQAEFIINRLQDHGYEAYVVGGCVRDMLLGRNPHDWDITTSARPEQVKTLFKRTIDTGIAHGTVTVLEDRVGYEVTTYRTNMSEGINGDEKRMTFADELKDDLRCRDFTINAMAYNPAEGIVDLFGGQEDLKNGIIRCVDDAAARLQEDPLRIMRAVRFSAQLDFEIEEETKQRAMELVEQLWGVSAERIRDELFKLLVSPNPERFRTLYEMGVTSVILPEFDRAMDCPQNCPYHCYSVGEHILQAINCTPQDLALRLTAVLHDLAKPVVRKTDPDGTDHFRTHAEVGAEMARDIMKRLKCDNNTIDTVCKLVRYHDERIILDRSSVRKAINLVGRDLIFPLLQFQRADAAAKKPEVAQRGLVWLDELEEIYRDIIEKQECTSLRMLAVSGKDLIAAGVTPGKEMGAILNRLLEHVLEKPEDNKKEILLGMVEGIRQDL